ncbi:tRNA (adenosine(37)-N6)-dimethylallyltransferase MiaA [Tenacibaculum sp. C7A-26P2]|uniref:tRNA (adenosine(37)-N6)-dimethylallyltransferase MiaA n=1 Tax=Tenacibaculum sp. C7A-26P2 TaxID=3447504 RepID=UPI003F864DE6
MNKLLISIVGATGIGKTALSIKLANHYNCDIISCDSRQFYKEMTIGTAVPSEEELNAANHHFIQNRSITESYNVGQFEKEALQKIDELFLKSPIQIMVGGSGLYLDAVLKGLDYFPKVDSSIRLDLSKKMKLEGINSLQTLLKKYDPEAYDTIAIDNPHRLIRALEICIGTDQKYSSFKNKPKLKRNFKSIKIGLKADREIIYDRINKRVDIMIKNGLIDEVKSLHQFKELNALQTVGYKELFDYFEGKIPMKEAIEEIKKNTRRFAKRQGTWFRKDSEIIWFDFKEKLECIVSAIESNIV